MNALRSWFPKIATVAVAALAAGCFDEPPDTTNMVFADDYAPGVGYQAFANSKLDAARRDASEQYVGVASLNYRVPTPGEPGAGEFNFSGGAFTSDRPRDLSRFTALVFWGRASRGVAIASMGLGNDNTGTSRFQTESTNVALTTEWARYVLPIPAPQKLTAERGLFWLAAGAAGLPPTGYDVWFDDVKFEDLDTAGWNPRPTLAPTNAGLDLGATAQIEGTAATYTIDGRELTVAVLPATFDYVSSNPAVATVDTSGVITATGNGTAVISATLAGVAVPETVAVTVPAPELTQMDLPVTFDAATVDYGLLGFGGAENSSIVVDPTGGPNRVARVVRSATAEVFAGTTITAPEMLGFANEVPFTATATRMTVRVFTPAANIAVRLKVEDHTSSGTSVETEARTTMANGWETLTFDFANQVAGTPALNLASRYDKAIVFFDFGAGGGAVGERTYYFDDVAFGGGGGGMVQMDLPVTFDAANVMYGLLGFGGAEDSTIVADPAGGANQVARVVKNATAELWAGTTLTANGTLGFASEIPFTATATRMTVRVYSPAAGVPVRLKVEDHTDATHSVETEAMTTMANGWETLTFDFATQAAGTAALNLGFNYDKASIFFNFGTPGAVTGARTYYFDDVAFGGGGGGMVQMDLPVTFDAANVMYGLLGFGGAEDSTIVADPAGGANQVARVVKNATAELWAGTTLTANGTLGFASEIPFTATATRMTVRVYSPAAGVPVRLKVEDHTDATHSVETEAMTTMANGWETLTFDFATQAAGTAALNLGFNYDKASIFFNFGTPGAVTGARTYYFDDVAFGGGGGGMVQMDLPVTFDAANVMYGLLGFGGAEDSTIVADPAGGANQVARVVKNATAELWAGTTLTANGTLGFASEIPFTATATRMTVRVYSAAAGVPVRLKVEDHTDPTHSVETEAMTTMANGWETLTFDFATQAAGTAALNLGFNYDKASIFFNFGTPGAVTGARTYYFDDVAFGGGGGGMVQMDLPVTFDAANVMYGLLGFGGAEDSTIVADPAGGANQVARVVKNATAELWAGTTLTANGTLGFASEIPFTATATRMTVRVYSPAAGVPVRLKVEDHTDATHSVETEAMTTMANGWETLTFDFATQAAGTAALNLGFNYDKASIFFNFGTPGAVTGARTYYFDDVAFGGGGGGMVQMDLPVTFDAANVMYGLLGFGGAEDSTIVADPAGGANQVARVVKNATAELWAGTTLTANGTLGFASEIPFTATATRMTVRVYSAAAGVPVRLKVEDHTDPTHSVETEAMTTMANGWETLTFDFATQAAGTAALNLGFNYDKASIFFNFGTPGAVTGARTYYFDDVAFGGGTPPPTFSPITFSDAGVTYTLTGFGGAEDATVVVDPTLATNQVARVVKSGTAELWAGVTVSTGANTTIPRVPFTATATSMTARVWSPHAGIPVRLKLEDAADPTHSVETEAMVTVASGWQTLTFNFASQAPGTAALNLTYTFNRASIFFNFGTTGAVAGARTYYFDDLAFGGSTPPPPTWSPITFSDAGVTYTLAGFGGAEDATVVVDPTLATNQVARVVKSGTAELWAGVTVSTGAGNTIPRVPFTATATSMTARVWSPHAGIQVRLKVEDATDPTRSCETEATVTVASGWQTLTFNFANQAPGTAALNLTYTFTRASIFFNFGTTGAVAGARTYYVDDLAFAP